MFAMLSSLLPKCVLVNIYIEHSYNKSRFNTITIHMDYTICRQHMYTKNEEHGCTQTAL